MKHTTVLFISSLMAIAAADHHHDKASEEDAYVREKTAARVLRRHKDTARDQHRVIDGLTKPEDQELIGWEEVIQRFPDAFAANLEQTKQLAERNSSSNSTSSDIPRSPFFNVGYAKQGTTSTNGFFNCLHYSACHFKIKSASNQIANCFYEAKISNRPLLKTCGYGNGLCESYHQMEKGFEGLIPQLEDLETLVKEQPQLTLLLPFRDFESWVTSQNNWSATHTMPDMIELRDENSPFLGLNGFDSITRLQGTKRHIEMFETRQREQQLLIKNAIHNDYGQDDLPFDNEFRHIIRQLDQLRGIDKIGRLALFYVYHVSYIRNFARQHQTTTLIEFELNSNETASLLGQIFQISHEEHKNYCWRQVNPTIQTKAGI